MHRRSAKLITALSAALLAAFAVSAQEPPLPPLATDIFAAEPEPVRRWLDEVKAQRRAREERRRAAKEAMDARRRWIDPWGAAQQQAREQEIQRRHEALMEHIERDRKTFRNQVPWGFLYSPWESETTTPPAEIPPSAGTDSSGMAGQAAPNTSPYPLPGWDNRWYYRGF
jgi:hypothetical protein